MNASTRILLPSALALLVAACGGDDDGDGDGAGQPDAGGAALPEASEDWTRDLVSTDLQIDLTAMTGVATIRIADADSTGASFEIGSLTITGVTGPGGALNFEVSDGQLDVGVPDLGEPVDIEITYEFVAHDAFDGWMPESGVSFLWPYFCGNLFPCVSNPAEGQSFSISVTGVPDGLEAVYPSSIPGDAPAYMPAIAVADFTEVDLGTTEAGTALKIWHLPGQADDAAQGTQNLLAVMNFFEQTYGEYAYGDVAGTVSADWGGGDYGGMEHHPFWHVSSGSLYSEEVNAHEAAHGWYGNGVRIECWEDFVLSEGTVTYMAARALGEQGVDIWGDYACQLRSYCTSETSNTIALPDGCNSIDILEHPLWSGVPYMKGAYFFRAVAELVGAEQLDAVLAAFYQEHVGGAARMQDLLDALAAAHPDDAEAIEALADGWLRQLECPETPACP